MHFKLEKYRKRSFEELNNQKISKHLISFAVKLSLGLKESVGLRWVVLTPDNDELERYYIEAFGFTKHRSKKDNSSHLFIAIN